LYAIKNDVRTRQLFVVFFVFVYIGATVDDQCLIFFSQQTM